MRLVLVLLPFYLSPPAMADYNRTLNNGIDKFKISISGDIVYHGLASRARANLYSIIKSEYFKGKAKLPDYKDPMVLVKVSDAEFKRSINRTSYFEVDNLSGSNEYPRHQA